MNFYDSIIEGAQELPPLVRGQLYAAVLEYLYYGREPEFAMRPAAKATFIAMKPVFDNQRQQSERGKKGGRPAKSAQGKEHEAEESSKGCRECPDQKEREAQERDSEQVASEAQAEPRPTESASKTETRTKAPLSAEVPKTETRTDEPLFEKDTISESEQEQEQEQENKREKKEGKKESARFVKPTPQEVDAYIRERGYTGFDGETFCAFYESKGWRVGRQPMKSWKSAVVTWAKRHADQRGGGDDFGDWGW